MSESLPERRMAENEVLFRQYNESIEKGFDELRKVAKEDGQEHMFTADDTPLHFYCECSDENCTKRILLTPSQYAGIHKNRNQFVIMPGHDVPRIEKIVVEEADYCVVEKYVTPPKSASMLNPTETDNS